MTKRSCLILLSLVGAVFAVSFVLLGPGPSGIVLGEDSEEADETVNQGQASAQAALEAHRSAHRSSFARVVQFMPLYSIASGDRTSVFLLNMFADTIPVTLTAYDAYGNPYTLFEHQVEPRTHLELSLNQALASAGSRYLEGSLSIEYQGEASTVSAWAVLQRGSHATEIPFSVASQFQSTTLRAFWDTQPLSHMANGVPTYAVMNTASSPLTFSVTIQAGRETSVSNHRLQPRARRVFTMPQDSESGSLVIEHQGVPGDLVGAGLLEGNGLLAPLPVVVPAALESSKHHALRVPTTGWLRTWLTLANPSVRSQTATLSAYDPVSGARLARITQTVEAETVQTVSLVTLLGSLGSTRPQEVRITVDHSGRPSSLLVSGAKLSRSGQVQSIPFFQDGQAHHNGTYPLLNGSRGSVSTTWLNLGEAPAKVVAQLDWEGGTYALPEITIAAGASHRLDFAELIRQAKPDLLERELNSSYRKGFFRWSARGGSRKLLARTEVEPAEGGRFGFNCAGCCVEFPYGAIEPGSVTFPVGSTASFVAGEYRNTCSGDLLGPYHATSPVLTVPSPFSWNGFTLSASGPGSGTLSFTATATRYEVISGICMTFTDIVADSASSTSTKVEIISADVTTNQIKVKLSPSGLSGNFTLKLTDPNSHTLLNAVTRVSGTHTESFNNSSLPNGEYKKVQASWTANDATVSAVRNYHIKVLGTYSHTRYNSPIEAQCSGSSTRQFQYNDDGDCAGISCGTVTWTLDTAKPLWVTEVGENGSGVHSQAGLLSQEWYCPEPSLQGGGDPTGVIMRKVSQPCGSCSRRTLVAHKTVAINVENMQLSCGDKVWVHGLNNGAKGVVTVVDSGDLSLTQLDHYYGKTACNNAPSIGNAKTIKLF